MRVLFINSVFPNGSTGKIVKSISEELLNSGNQCLVIYGRNKNEYNGKVPNIYIGTFIGHFVDLMNTRLFDKHGLTNKKSTRKLIKNIEKFKPDVIHIHNIHGYYLNYEILFTYLKNVYKGKIIWTLHDSWSVSGHSATLDYNNGLVPTTQLNSLEKKSYPQTFFKMRWNKNYLSKKKSFSSLPNMALVTPSKWLKEFIDQTFLSMYPCYVVNNGISAVHSNKKISSDIKKIVSDLKKNNKKIILGVSNHWIKDKGIEVFNNLSHLIQEDYKIILVGKEDNIEIDDEIIHIEYTESFDDLAYLYKNSYCFVNPTFFDNFPTVNIEALTYGLPVITFDSGGSKEILTTDTGIVCPDKNEKCINDMLEKVSFIDREKCKKRGESFNVEKMVKEYIEIYKEEK